MLLPRLTHVNENYFHHFGEAFLTASVSIAAGVICLVHAVLPFTFTHTASDMLKWILNRHETRTSQ